MERLTRQVDGIYTSEQDVQALLARLGRFEDLWEHVVMDQASLPGQLEELRAAGKTKSYQFRELMGRKLNNAYVMSLFQDFGLKG